MLGLEGKWYNAQTKKSVFVKDTYSEDGRMYVMLADGTSMTMEKFQNNYVQISDETYDASGKQIGTAPVRQEPNIPELMAAEDGISEVAVNDDTASDILNRPLVGGKDFEFEEDLTALPKNKQLKQDGFHPNAHKFQPRKSPNFAVIDKAFTKGEYKYTYDIVSKSEYPKRIHEFLREFTDVTDKEIVEYMIEKFANVEEIKKAVRKEIERMFGIDHEDEKTPDVSI